jgi:hypothetical protein
MPMYYYQCETCKKERRRICSPEESGKAPSCCGQPMKRAPRACTSRCVETLDNGLMTKSLERLTDAERLFHERAEVTKKQQRGE